MTDSQTIGVYDALAEEYDRKFERAEPDRHLIAFLERLPRRSHILDLGCGPGRTAAFMIEAGHSVDAVDASAIFVSAAKARGVTARQATFDEIWGLDLYEGVWANFSLLHAPRTEFIHHVSTIAKTLKPGGLLHLGMKEGHGERRDRLGRFYTYYSEGELRRILTGSGLKISNVDKGAEAGLAGTVEPWIIMTAHA